MARKSGVDLDAYINEHQHNPRPREALHGLRTIDSTRRAKLEHEAMMTGVLAVLLCWIPFFTIFTLVAGFGRWAESRRSFGGNNGAFATIFSALAIVCWIVFFATAPA